MGEEKEAAMRDTQAQASAIKEHGAAVAQTEHENLSSASASYKLYHTLSGVRFDAESDGRRGYVALGNSVKPFELQGNDDAADADELWAAIAACLPASSQSKQQPQRTPAARAGA